MKIEIFVHTNGSAAPKNIHTDDNITLGEFAALVHAAGVALEELENEIHLQIGDEQKIFKTGQTLSHCGIWHGHHVKFGERHTKRHHHAHHNNHHGHDTIELTIVVTGKPTKVHINIHDALVSVIPPALKQTGNEGQPPENWELKDAKGTPLDLNRKIESFHFPHDTKLFLSLRAGIGG